MSEEIAKDELGKLLAAPDYVCHYVGDIFNEATEKADYMVFVSDDRSLVMPLKFGEEITHGEHVTQHTRDNGSLSEFLRRFSVPSEEFVGMLGSSITAKNYPPNYHVKLNLNDAPLKISGDAIEQSDLDHSIGYCVALQLANSGKEIPYSSLFHAPDQKTLWGIAGEIVTPSIGLPIPKGVNKDKISEQVQKALKNCELDAPLYFLE